jgi:hypothetical protein
MESMESKRPGERVVNKESKRAKTDFPLDIELSGVQYMNLSRLLTQTVPFAAYFTKHYKSMKRLLEKETELEVFNISKQNVTQGVFEAKEAFSSGCDLRLVRKDGYINNFIERVHGESHLMAPPIIDDIEFFEDALGQKYAVEMRGERNVGGIYLKVKDVGRTFGTANLANDVQHNAAAANEGEDYVRFVIPETHKCELFFTFLGLLRAIMRSRLPGSVRLCVWVCKTVFCASLGTQEQKDTLGRSLLNKETIDELTKRCVNSIGGLYLLETMITPPKDDTGVKKKVYKYGFTKNVQQRMQKHVNTYGRDSVIHALVLLPIKYVSTAEAKLKHILSDNYIHEEGKNTELLLLSHQELTTVRESMRVVGETFYGETFVHAHQLEMLQQSRDHAIEMLKKDVEVAVEVAKNNVEVAKNNAELAKKDGEVAKRDIVILEMKNEIQARRIKELEDKLWLYKTNIANAA